LWEGGRHQWRLEHAEPLQRRHHVRGEPAARVVKGAIELRGLRPEDVVCAGVVTAPALAAAWIVPALIAHLFEEALGILQICVAVVRTPAIGHAVVSVLAVDQKARLQAMVGTVCLL